MTYSNRQPHYIEERPGRPPVPKSVDTNYPRGVINYMVHAVVGLAPPLEDWKRRKRAAFNVLRSEGYTVAEQDEIIDRIYEGYENVIAEWDW